MVIAVHGGHYDFLLIYVFVHRDNLQTDGLLLVAVILPTPSFGTSANTAPRGIKRGRTPDQRGLSRADGDHDDGMCASRGLIRFAYTPCEALSSRFVSFNHYLLFY